MSIWPSIAIPGVARDPRGWGRAMSRARAVRSTASAIATWVTNDPAAATADPQLERRIVLIRWLGLLVTAIGGPFLVAGGYLLGFYVCLAIVALVNLAYSLPAVVVRQPTWLRALYVCGTFDIVLATTIIVTTEGPHSPFTLAYFPIAVNAAIRFGARAGLLASLVIMLCFTGGVTLSGQPLPANSPLYLLGASFLVLTALFSSLLSNRVRRAEQALAYQLAQERALNQASSALSGNLEWTAVLQRVVEQARLLTDADVAILDLRRLPGGDDPEEGEVLRRATETVPSGAYLAKVLLQSGLLLELPPPRDGQVTIHRTATGGDPLGEVTEWLPPASLLRVPIMRQGQWHGDLLLLRTQNRPPFTAADATMIPAFANQAGLMLENARLYGRAMRQAATDPVTHLPNHRALKERLATEVQRASRHERPLSVLMLDIDHFKAFNDAFGHAAGDVALREVASILRRGLRRDDFAARYGGEEFLMVLPETTVAEAAPAAERIRMQVANLAVQPGSRVPASLTVSIGIASYPDDRTDCNQLLQAADLAMYLAKHEGRNQVRLAAELTSQEGVHAVLDQLVSQVALPHLHWGPQLVNDLEGRFRRLALLRDESVAGAAAGAEYVDRYTVEAVTTLATTIEAKDPYTAGHSRQVAALGEVLARAAGCDQEAIETVQVGGLLHDIGKIGIPEAVLNKPDRLTDEEWLLMRSHPDIGARILAPVTALRAIIPIVRHHHERWDGQGYPLRLAGEETPLVARIICLCDAYDTMVSDRPYRRGLGHDEAVHRLREGAGTQFDPHLVAVFTALLRVEIEAALAAARTATEAALAEGEAQAVCLA